MPAPAQVVKLRSRCWLVEGVDPSPDGKWHLVSLSCIDDDAQRQQLQVVWEAEIDPRIIGEEAWETIGSKDKQPSFDAVRDFAAYFRTLRWNCVTSTNPRTFQSPFRAGIKLDPYQLVPLAKALQLPRVNLFIADDVGLGKTIEAGLVASEMLLRKRIDTVVVACPPSMIYQWRDELESKFGLDFQILDRAYVRRMREERGHATNPWETHSNLIVSHRLLIDEAYAGPLRSFLGNLRPGSLLILDECHNAAPSSGAPTIRSRTIRITALRESTSNATAPGRSAALTTTTTPISSWTYSLMPTRPASWRALSPAPRFRSAATSPTITSSNSAPASSRSDSRSKSTVTFI